MPLPDHQIPFAWDMIASPTTQMKDRFFLSSSLAVNAHYNYPLDHANASADSRYANSAGPLTSAYTGDLSISGDYTGKQALKIQLNQIDAKTLTQLVEKINFRVKNGDPAKGLKSIDLLKDPASFYGTSFDDLLLFSELKPIEIQAAIQVNTSKPIIGFIHATISDSAIPINHDSEGSPDLLVSLPDFELRRV